MLRKIETRIEATTRALEQIGYSVQKVSAQEFYDYMTGEIFSEDPTTLEDVLGSEYLMVHELVEMSELKKIGRTIDKRVIVDTPKSLIYTAHLNAMEWELDYALSKEDYFWIKIRLRHHKESVLEDDPNLPQELRPRAEALFEKFRKTVRYRSTLAHA